jgi:hydrogenase-1 operon protein HyaF
MNRLAAIAVRLESLPGAASPLPPPAPAGRGNCVDAILSELAGLLERLDTHQVAATLDLRSLPMSPADRAELQRVLGPGELRATLVASGESTIVDTAIPGIWWTRHHDATGTLTAELLEVTRIPPILVNDPGELPAASAALRALIAARQRAAS